MKLRVYPAVQVLDRARKEVKENPGYRFGQALFNLLPNPVADSIRGTENDFFYELDDEIVLQKFYDHCVENHNHVM